MDEIANKKSDTEKILMYIVVWCIFFFIFCGRETAYAKERVEYWEGGGLSLTATFSYQEEDFPEEENTSEITLRAGRDFMLRLKVTAQTEEFSGYVNVLMQNEGGNHALYQHRIEAISAGESVSCQMLLPMNLMTGGLYLTLTNEEGEVALEQTLLIETVNYGQYEMIAVFDPKQEMPEGNMYGHFASFGNRLVDISESEMACGAQSMDALEIIVTQESVLSEMEERTISQEEERTESASESLKEWVTSGKTLVVGASAEPEMEEEMLNFGLQEKEILQGVMLRIGNYEVTRESILATNEEVKRQYGENARTCYIGDSMIGDSSVNALSDRAVSLPVKRTQTGEYWWNSDASYETLWHERGTDILRCYHVGKGNVLVFMVPITAEPAEIYPLFYYRMVEMVLDHLTQTQLTRQDNEMYGNYAGSTLYYQLSGIRAGNHGISVFPYVLILMGYILILIPLVFLLLRHFEKTKYLWGILPALSFGVMGMVYWAGGRTRITQPYCTYIDIIDYTQGREDIYFSLSAPTNEGTEIMLGKGISVRLAETGFRAYEAGWTNDYVPEENLLRAREYRTAVCALPEGTRLCLDTIRAFSNTSFYAWASAPSTDGALLLKVTAKDKVVAGTLQNTTNQAFREIYICNRSFVVRVDGIEAGEKVLLEHCRQNVAEEDSEDNLIVDFYWLMFDVINNDNYTEYSIINQMCYDYMMEDNEKTYIFALPQEIESELLGATADNPGSGGVQVFVWGAEEEP